MADIWQKVKTMGEEERFFALYGLLMELSQIYEKPVNIVYDANIGSPCYSPVLKTIYLNKNLSILSSLHEFAHHLYGPSELKACRWSVSNFKAAFPKAYSKLEWKGHLLIKKQPTATCQKLS